MAMDKKKMICGNCKMWEKTDQAIKGMAMGRCTKDARPFMSLNQGCTSLNESSFKDNGYKLDKLPKATF